MILSASRRTDIPAYYSEWFYRRIEEGFVWVRTPKNPHRISKIDLSPDVVDGIVFWSKNPLPMLQRLDELKAYPFYFQFTLNAYAKDVESHVPSKNDVLIPGFQALSQKIGKARVLWRYDPIFFNAHYTYRYHCKAFESLVRKLHPYTDLCTISFIDLYRSTQRNTRSLNLRRPSTEEQAELLTHFAAIAAQYGLSIATCAEAVGTAGIASARCIDSARLERIGGYALRVDKDKNQRPECGCASSIDIGMYHSCKNGCLYCYANHSLTAVKSNFEKHVVDAPLLYGALTQGDYLVERPVVSCKVRQLDLFEHLTE